MAGEKDKLDYYLETIERLEPDISPIDASAFYASAAISLKRIADAAEQQSKMVKDWIDFDVFQRTKRDGAR